MHNVNVAAAVVPLERSLELSKGWYTYRIYVRIDAAELFQGYHDQPHSPPHDWNEEEDGPWEPKEQASTITCLARYFQFTTVGGRHAPFGLWPARAMCELTYAAPLSHDSFDVRLRERVAQMIGGVVLGQAQHDVKLPRLDVPGEHVDNAPQPPPWAKLCKHVGQVTLPDGSWNLAAEVMEEIDY